MSGKAAYCQTALTRLDVGQTVESWPDYCTRFGQSDFLRVLEQFRPAHLLSYRQAVVMHASVDDLENSDGDEWLYELSVAAESPIQRHDSYWANKIALLLASDTLSNKAAMVRYAAEKYWNGEPSHDPVWEYFAAQAVIVAVHSYPSTFGACQHA